MDHFYVILFAWMNISAAAASENGVFTSPEIAKSFDFTSEERIYNWYFLYIYFLFLLKMLHLLSF